MAATKRTATKSTARKTTARKPAAPKSAAAKTAAQAETEARSFAAQAQDQVEETVEVATERLETLMTDVVKYSKQAGYASVGAPFAVRARLTDGTIADWKSYDKFLDEAMSHGEKQVEEFQKMVEPYVKQATDIVDPLVERMESVLPAQAKGFLTDGRERFNKLIKA